MSEKKNKTPKKPLLLFILSGVTGAISIGFGVGFAIAQNYAGVINQGLGLTEKAYLQVDSENKSDDPKLQYFKSSYSSKSELLNADKTIAEQLTEEGSVLLKNNNDALPLASNAKVTILGHSSCNMFVCGTGSADIKADGAPSLYDTLTKRGVEVNKTVWDYYQGLVDSEQYMTNPKKGDNSIRSGDGAVKGSYTVNEVPWNTLTSASGVSSSFNSYNDAAIVVVSRLGGEMYDLPVDTASQGNASETVNGSGNSLELTIQELELIEKSKANFNKVIVLVNSANPIECDFLTKDGSNVDAALWIGYTGLQGLEGVADLLVGNTSPSGRLVDTYCNDNTTSPAMENFYSESWSNANDTKYASDMKDISLDSNMYFNAYQEGIYVGYRYYETRYEDYIYARDGVGEYKYLNDVAYPFGYGLSYTTFTYSKPTFTYNETEDTIDISLKVTNSGKVKGKDVVEIYFQSEYTDYDKTNGIEKSAVELCGFAKTAELDANASEDVTISVPRSEFATYDAKDAKTYILDKGDYYVSVGRNAHDALNNIIAKKTTTRSSLMTAIGNENQYGDADNVYKFTVDTIDSETYAYGEDGEKITNQMDEASLSFYGLTDMTYLSRSNWTGTWPSKMQIALNDKMHSEMTSIKDYTKEETDEKLPTMDAHNGKTLAMYRQKDYDDESWNDLLDQLSYTDMCDMVGVGYHGMTSVYSVGKPATKDENGPQGFSSTLTDVTGNAETLCAYTDENIMAATWNTTFMEELGEHIGEDGLNLGYNGLYGPAMNTHRSPYGGRNFEYYSEDGFLAGKIAAAEVTGIQKKGVYVFVKHFALNDEETHCRSIATFANEQSIREIYLKPFECAIREGKAYNVMTSFARVGVVWSSAHKGLMTNILRNEWGMTGFAVSDYTTSGITTSVHNRTTYDALLAVPAGTDTFDSSSATAQCKQLKSLDYKNDPHMVNAMRTACHRILYVTSHSNAMNGVSESTMMVTVLVWWQMLIIDMIIYFGIACITLLIIGLVKMNKYKKFKAAGEVQAEPQDSPKEGGDL